MQKIYKQKLILKTLKQINLRLFILYSQNNTITKKYSRNILLLKIDYK